MNYIRHLTGFFDKIQEDERLNPTHISLYIALFQFWNVNHFRNPISISRNEMMKLSKISAYGTYHKCIKELQEFGYIEYIPSFNPYKGSTVNLFEFDDSDDYDLPKSENEQISKSNHIRKSASSEKLSQTVSEIEQVAYQKLNKNHIKNRTGSEQVMNNYHIKIDTGFEQELIPSTNISNNTNYKTEEELAQPQKKLLDKKSVKIKIEKQGSKIPPEFFEVQMYFEEKDSTKWEAENFFNHYESNGWLVGGNSPMKNWQAGARKWLLNCKKYNFSTTEKSKISIPNFGRIPQPHHLNATVQKSYQEKL